MYSNKPRYASVYLIGMHADMFQSGLLAGYAL